MAVYLVLKIEIKAQILHAAPIVALYSDHKENLGSEVINSFIKNQDFDKIGPQLIIEKCTK